MVVVVRRQPNSRTHGPLCGGEQPRTRVERVPSSTPQWNERASAKFLCGACLTARASIRVCRSKPRHYKSLIINGVRIVILLSWI